MPDPIRLSEWRIQITNCAGTPMEIKLAAPEQFNAQDVLVKLGAAIDYPLEVLVERLFAVPKELDIMFTKELPVELFQHTRYKIEYRPPGCDWTNFHALGDLRFGTEAEAESKALQMASMGWSRKDLRVVTDNG
jgi:hypothetical protein